MHRPGRACSSTGHGTRRQNRQTGCHLSEPIMQRPHMIRGYTDTLRTRLPKSLLSHDAQAQLACAAMAEETHDELGPLRLLLRHLLGLNCTSVFPAESQVGDGDIVQHQVEVLCTGCQQRADVPADHLRSMNASTAAPCGCNHANLQEGLGSLPRTCMLLRQEPTSRMVMS